MITAKQGIPIGKYLPLKPIGAGGDGTVWIGMHCDTGQLWALKVIPRTERGQERHELEMMRRLRHPSLPRVLELMEEEQDVILVMEYINGICLEELITGGRRLSPEQAEDAALQISSALVYLHSRKPPVLHLDLKPSNLILCPDGRIVLLDFGASLMPDQSLIVRKGTDGYAAPEQYEPDSRLDERTDLYILGCVLYRLVSGVKYSQALKKSHIPCCPDDFARIIRGCLEEDPAGRFRSAEELSRNLQRMRRRRHMEQARIRFWAGLWLCILAAGAAGSGLMHEMTAALPREAGYEQLLRRAATAPEEDCLNLYQEAVYLEPERREAWMQYLDWKEQDHIFTGAEDRELRSLLYRVCPGHSETFEEILRKDPAVYGEIACRIGTIYRFEYEGDDAQRIADGWFEKAAAAAEGLLPGECRKDDGIPDFRAFPEEVPEWIRTAIVCSRLGSCRQLCAAPYARSSAFLDYWRDTDLVLEQIDSIFNDQDSMLFLLRDLLVQQLLWEDRYLESGITGEQLEGRIGQIRLMKEELELQHTEGSLSGEKPQVFEEMDALLEKLEANDKNRGDAY